MCYSLFQQHGSVTRRNEYGETREEVLFILEREGTIRYFYLQGGLDVINKRGRSVDESYLPMDLFLELRRDEIISMTGNSSDGSGRRATVYSLAKKAAPATA